MSNTTLSNIEHAVWTQVAVGGDVGLLSHCAGNGAYVIESNSLPDPSVEFGHIVDLNNPNLNFNLQVGQNLYARTKRIGTTSLAVTKE